VTQEIIVAWVLTLFLTLIAIYTGYRAVTRRPYRWSVGTVLAIWVFLFIAFLWIWSGTIH